MSDLTIQRELDAVDDALATGTTLAVDPVERELRELAVALQADAPTPEPAFAATLRGKVEAGFSSERRSVWDFLTTTPMRIGGGVAVAAAVVLALIVANQPSSVDTFSSGGGQVAGDDAASSGGAAESGTIEPAPDSATSDQDLAIPPSTSPPSSGGDFAPGRAQRIARSAALTLAAPGDQLDRLSDRVIAVTDRHRGYVLQSNVTAGGGADAGGTLELRIPAERLRPAVRDLSALATVRSSTQAGEDVTGRFLSARDRLDAAKAERVSLLRRLENAETDTQTEALKARLRIVAGEINAIEGQLRQLRQRTNYAAVTVALEPKKSEGAAAPSSTEDALDDSVGILQGAFNVALRVAAVLLPFALLGGLAWWAAATLRKRRRESALGA